MRACSRSGRLVAVTVLLTLLGAAVPAAVAAPQDRCPAAKTCGDFALFDYRWPSKPDGRVVIPYLVNPGGQVTMTEVEVVGAVQAAMRVWQRANPRLVFRFDGVTRLVPGIPDGANVIGFGPIAVGSGLASITSVDEVVVEADVTLDAASTWLWEECRQQDNACGEPHPVLIDVEDPIFGHRLRHLSAKDVQGILTHELGHWVSLAHASRPGGGQQTMFGTAGFTLSNQTLALGDVLGVRAAYPCGRCGGPPVVFAP